MTELQAYGQIENGGLARKRSTNALGAAVLITCIAFLSPILALCIALALFAGSPTRKMALACAFGFALSMALIVSGIEYRHAVDVTRWMAECRFYTGKSITAITASSNSDHTNLWVWNFWCWIVGNSGDLSLLQTSGAFIGFGLIAWMMMDTCAKEKTDAVAFLSLFIFAVLAVHMQAVVAYMRSTMGCILCATAFYVRRSYSFKASIPSLILVLLACGIHSAMLVGLALYIVQPAIAKNPKTAALVCAIALVVTVSFASVMAMSNFLDSMPMVRDALRKAYFYTIGTEWDQEQAEDTLAVTGHALSVMLLILLMFRTFLTSQHDYRFSIMLVSGLCVLAMEATLVNVGNRLIYIPLLLGSTLCLNNEERESLAKTKWPLLIDPILFMVAAAVCLIAFRDFIPSFNYSEVVKYAIFYPSKLL